MRHFPDAWPEATEQPAPEGVTLSCSDDELLALTMAVATINVFNRVNVALRTVPGTYQPNDPAIEQLRAAVAS